MCSSSLHNFFRISVYDINNFFGGYKKRIDITLHISWIHEIQSLKQLLGTLKRCSIVGMRNEDVYPFWLPLQLTWKKLNIYMKLSEKIIFTWISLWECAKDKCIPNVLVKLWVWYAARWYDVEVPKKHTFFTS